jgi:hypothetical protein
MTQSNNELEKLVIDLELGIRGIVILSDAAYSIRNTQEWLRLAIQPTFNQKDQALSRVRNEALEEAAIMVEQIACDHLTCERDWCNDDYNDLAKDIRTLKSPCDGGGR